MKTENINPTSDNITVLRFNILCVAYGAMAYISGYIYADLYSWLKILAVYITILGLSIIFINKIVRRKSKLIFYFRFCLF
jgi:hypothetical protein